MAGDTSIGKASGEGVISLGQQAWNIADGFTKIKILRILIELDLYETIAMFGTKDIDEPNISYEYIPYKRVEGLHRMLFSLRQLIGNCKFSIDDKKDRELINSMGARIDNVEEVIDGISNESINEVTKEKDLAINEEHFRKCFDILRNIKDELNFPINRAGLIFRQSDEMDLDRIMKDIVEGG